MKKILIVFAVILCVGMATSAFAAAITAETSVGSVTFSPSAKVSCSVVSNDFQQQPPNVYGVKCWHSGAINQSGGYEWGATSSDSTIKKATLEKTLTVKACAAISMTTDGTVNLAATCPGSIGAWSSQ